MGAQGTAVINFGAFPGASDASVAVTGQASIVAGSLVEAWIRPIDTADHSADEHMLETIKVFAANIIAGTGFTIYAFNTSEVHENRYQSAGRGREPDSRSGTLIYGQWNLAWAWN